MRAQIVAVLLDAGKHSFQNEGYVRQVYNVVCVVLIHLCEHVRDVCDCADDRQCDVVPALRVKRLQVVQIHLLLFLVFDWGCQRLVALNRTCDPQAFAYVFEELFCEARLQGVLDQFLLFKELF